MNVLMDGDGRSVLSDFGIAKVMASSTALTRLGAGVGTPEYMSPEQCRGVEVDARADIYALGVMLYEMLTGRTPFVADNFTALAHSHIYEYARPAIVAQSACLASGAERGYEGAGERSANRFQKATEMAVALEQAVAAQTPVSGGSTTSPADAALPALPVAQQRQPAFLFDLWLRLWSTAREQLPTGCANGRAAMSPVRRAARRTVRSIASARNAVSRSSASASGRLIRRRRCRLPTPSFRAALRAHHRHHPSGR